MNHASTHAIAAEHGSQCARRPTIRAVDTSGFVIFSQGGDGGAHVIAHRMLDQGRIALGHDRLGAWLDGRKGHGSSWVHLQFHMAIFELGIGDWSAAYERFLAEILPVAAATEDALTDAPGLLWRLAIAAPEAVELPWEPLRRTALAGMSHSREPFVELYRLLTFAGAGDRDSIDAWLRLHARQIHSQRQWLVVQTVDALRAYVDGTYATAANVLERLAPWIPRVGGSRAQNELLGDLAEHCRRRATCARKTGHLDGTTRVSGETQKKRRWPRGLSASNDGAAAPRMSQSISASTSVAMKQPPTPS